MSVSLGFAANVVFSELEGLVSLLEQRGKVIGAYSTSRSSRIVLATVSRSSFAVPITRTRLCLTKV
jgi:hypothetical protein